MCGAALIPSINSMPDNISALVREIRSSDAFRTSGSAQYGAIRKGETAVAALIQTAASMDEMEANTKTMRIIPEWRAFRRMVQPNAPTKMVS